MKNVFLLFLISIITITLNAQLLKEKHNFTNPIIDLSGTKAQPPRPRNHARRARPGRRALRISGPIRVRRRVRRGEIGPVQGGPQAIRRAARRPRDERPGPLSVGPDRTRRERLRRGPHDRLAGREHLPEERGRGRLPQPRPADRGEGR